MATKRYAHTDWNGDLIHGQGLVTLDSSGAGEYPVTWASRSQEANGKTSPEELIGAAHSSCFSMALANSLAEAGTPPTRLKTRAEVTLQPGKGITDIVLSVEGSVPGLDESAFIAAAEDAKLNCPVSQALAGTSITLRATLAQ
ncbi:OsmC family peroxiredoxin [Streptomyces sp. NPDC090080]|uniref:OsmC family peroxiredoxin n=1 Tax=Streptomyces sp. NPDC090080 TaxID=3365939 RepID=UPI003805F147